MSRRVFLMIFLMMGLLITPAYAGGGALTGGSTEITQLANKAQLIKSLAEQVAQTKKMIDQYLNMLQNTIQLPAKVWADATNQLNSLKSIVQKGSALSFAAAMDETLFKKLHPGYKAPEKFVENYKERVNNWTQYYKNVLKANGVRYDELEKEKNLVEQMKSLAGNTEGQHQALQAGNMIAAHMVEQLRQLRADMLRQIDAQAQFAENEQQERTEEIAAIEKAIGTWQDMTPSKGY